MFLGDVVGRSGRDAVYQHLPILRERYRPDCVVVNGENAAHGFGITEEIYLKLRDAGADVVTLGNHSFDQREILVTIEREGNLIRPLNWPSGCPGRGTALVETAGGQRVLVINGMGRVMVEPMLDDPFPAIDQEIEQCKLGRDCDAIILDFHAEASSEKMAMGHFCDGRVSVVVGTHTHTPTADHHILNGGTAYQTDAGMCGDYNSIIGFAPEGPMQGFLNKYRKIKMDPADGPGTLCGAIVEIKADGLAEKITPVQLQ